MTAPFAPPLPWEVKAILLGMLAITTALPFARREDWIGWTALLALFSFMVGMWALLIRGMASHTFQWWRHRSGRD